MHAPDPHLARLIADLSRPEAYPVPGEVTVVQTHASVVFLVGGEVWKVKKPLDLGFLDYSTLERRTRFAGQEVALNRRLAPDVYLGVDPITEGPTGRLRIGGAGPPVEVAVRMVRLPDEATLRHAVCQGALTPGDLAPIGRRLAAFHAGARRDATTAAMGRLSVVARLARDNLGALRQSAEVLGPEDVTRLEALTEAELARQAGLIEARAEAGVPCAFHGDLRLEHVYRFPDRPSPSDVVVLDGIEFDDTLRMGDPVADIAFLAMDLQAHGAWEHADVLLEAWHEATGDRQGEALVPLYLSYRSAVRAKVAAILLGEAEVPQEARHAALARARRHVRLAVGALTPARQRLRLLMTCGLPGSGKSTVARGLAGHLPLQILATDVVRKELAGLEPLVSAAAAPYAGIYTPAMTRRTYEAIAQRARDALETGHSVLLDGNFRTADSRAPFVALALELGVPAHILRVEAPDDVLRARLRARTGDASDADEAVLDHVRPSWQPPEGAGVIAVDTTRDDPVGDVLAALGAR